MSEKKRKPIGLTFNMDKEADRLLDEYTLAMKKRYGTPVATQFKEAMHYYMEHHPITEDNVEPTKDFIINNDNEKPLLGGASDMVSFQGFKGFDSDMLEDE